MKKTRILFFERSYPSANMILIKDKLSVIIDTGFGSDVQKTEDLIQEAGVMPKNIHLIVNTHYHSDHVGGNHHFQSTYGTPIAAHKWDAELINLSDKEACCAEWLDQPVEPYNVERKLQDGDIIHTGNSEWQVLHTPGHTLGHISLYNAEEETVIVGDLFHGRDVGWINIFREGVSSILQSLESLDKLSKLKIRLAYSGHGSAMENPQEAIDNARGRLEKWLKDPEKVSWHGIKRIFAFTLMINNGIAKEDLNDYLLSCGWFQDFSRHAFRVQPEQFIQPLLDEMIRSNAASWKNNYLMATTPYEAPKKQIYILPRDWPTQKL